MAGSETGQVRRTRRSTRVSRQLARARQRNNEQLARIRERERQVDQALGEYVAAAAEIDVAEAMCREKLEQLDRRVRQIRDERENRVAGLRGAQARAVLVIHASGRTVKQVAELLELSEKAARQLIGEARSTTRPERPDVSAPTVTVKAETSSHRPADRANEPGTEREDLREARQ